MYAINEGTSSPTAELLLNSLGTLGEMLLLDTIIIYIAFGYSFFNPSFLAFETQISRVDFSIFGADAFHFIVERDSGANYD